jgi:hypothetical protein
MPCHEKIKVEIKKLESLRPITQQINVKFDKDQFKAIKQQQERKYNEIT